MSPRIESESELIETFLAPLTARAPGALGLKDDAALISIDGGRDLVVSTDPIVAGVHFFPTDKPADIAWKALAVNMSDLAAKGADPLAFLMTLALPEAPEHAWMSEFAEGLAAAQTEFRCTLIGGDTDRTMGPLTIGVTAIGTVPKGSFVRRQTANAGDHVFVTGTLGDAALGLALHRDSALFQNVLSVKQRNHLVDRYLHPRPRLQMADALRSHASAALDVSDGFMKDLTRLAGGLGIETRFSYLPLSPALKTALAHDPRVVDAVLGGGDDYELLVAVPSSEIQAFTAAAHRAGLGITDIGILASATPISVVNATGTSLVPKRFGYDHFSK